MSQRHAPQTEGSPKKVPVQLRVERQEQREGQEHQEHQHFESLGRILPSRPLVLGVHRCRERSEGVVLDGPPQVRQFAHLKRRESLIGRDDPEVVAVAAGGPLQPIELDVSDFQRMRRIAVPQAGNGLNVKGYAPREIDSSGFFDRSGAALEDLLCIADEDEASFVFGGLDQEMSAQRLPTKADHPLSDVKAVPEHDVDDPRLVPLEKSAKDRFGGRKFLASVLRRLKIGHGRMSSQYLQHAGRSSSQNSAVDGAGPKGPTFGQRNLTVSVLAKEHQGLLKLFSDLTSIHPRKDSPEGGIAGDQVPRGAQPPTDLLLTSEEIDLMKAPAMERQSADQ